MSDLSFCNLIQEISYFKTWVLMFKGWPWNFSKGYWYAVLDFLLIHPIGMWCCTKFHPHIMFVVPWMGLQSNYGKLIPMDHQSVPIIILSLVPYCPILGHDTFKFVEREKFINVELSKYMDFWKQSIEQNATYKMKMIPYVEYWENVLLHLSKLLFFWSSILLEGF